MITINIHKAKAIAHDVRRAARAAEFKPFDEAIAKQIPEEFEVAEEARKAIRAKYAHMQQEIDAAESVEALKAAMPKPQTN
jgi:hypothetical protein